jgi:hypothetical protein
VWEGRSREAPPIPIILVAIATASEGGKRPMPDKERRLAEKETKV